MLDGTVSDVNNSVAVPRYGAFISYSHHDLAIVKKLHRKLEGYRIPANLVGSETPRGLVEDRLRPIFRDFDELPASDDLNAEIKAALSESAALVVVASPEAKASRWVNREIELFRELHGDARPILLALIRGEPEEAFPKTIYVGGAEPIAADFRKVGSGDQLARLKLIAGLTGLSLDSLVQRDAQRNLRRVTAITVGALLAVLIMGLLLAAALRARTEADRQRTQAEGLVEFMLTDLRDRLVGVGRLDVMQSVNNRAMSYYSDVESLEGLPPESLDRRSRILHAMGEDDDKRGNREAALAKFREAHRTTAAVLAQMPNDADAIFAHSQSEYWLGYVHQKQMRFREALAHCQAYGRLADRFAKVTNNSRAALREVGWSSNTIGALYMEGLQEPELAAPYLHRYADAFEALVKSDPSDAKSRYSLADAYSWLADTRAGVKDWQGALDFRQKAIAQHEVLLASDPNNMQTLYGYVVAKRSVFNALYRMGNRDQEAELVILETLKLASAPNIDAADVEWRVQRVRSHLGYGNLLHRWNRIPEARHQLDRAKSIADRLADRSQFETMLDSLSKKLK